MKQILFFIAFLFFASSASPQVNQVTIGAANVTILFNSVKYDASDGGSINVGYRNDPSTGTGNDIYMVKLNSAQQIVWQKVIPNAGDDYLIQVVICSNGDYVATGKVTQSGISRGYACRINKTNGNIIWAANTGNSSSGEVFWDVIETNKGNIALAGIDFLGSSNTFLVLLNSAGNTIWSKISSFGNSDGGFGINQLPNGNLIIGATKWVGYYNGVIMELDEVTGTILSQQSYTINVPAPGSGLTLNSLFPWSIKVINNTALLYIKSFQGCCSDFYISVYNYDQASKQLSGNIFNHTGVTYNSASVTNSIEYSFMPLSGNDFLIAQSFKSPSKVFVSRVTSGVVAYDRLLGGSIVSIYGIDTTATNAIYSGQATYNTFNNSFDLAAPRTVPAIASPCSITNSNTLTLQASVLSPSVTTDLNLSPSSALFASALASQNISYALNTICGSAVLPVTLINFNGYYNKTGNTSNLKWNTTNETNNKLFIVERSTDNGISYLPLGSVNAHGVINAGTSYSFIDNDPVKGKNLYRLKQVDVDDKFKYSNVVSIETTGEKISSYYLTPNPARNFTLINSTSASNTTVDIYVYDAAAKLIKQQIANIDRNHPYGLSINKASGIYYVKIRSDRSTDLLKLVIQ